MKGKEFFDIINDIDDSHILEMYEDRQPKEYKLDCPPAGFPWKTAAAAAACLAVIAAGVIIIRNGGYNAVTPLSPADISDESSELEDTVSPADKSVSDICDEMDAVMSELEEAFKNRGSELNSAASSSGESGDEPENASETSGFSQEIEWTDPLDNIPEEIDGVGTEDIFEVNLVGKQYYNTLGYCIPAGEGNNVYAAADGEVVYADEGWNGGYGGFVILEHAGGLYSCYGHLSYDYPIKVEKGDVVKAGDIIGYVGSTGRVYGSALHFRVCDSMPSVGETSDMTPVYDDDGNRIGWDTGGGNQIIDLPGMIETESDPTSMIITPAYDGDGNQIGWLETPA